MSLFVRLPPVQVLETEYERLCDLVCASPVETRAIALLWGELLRAELVDPEAAPRDLVRIGSVVQFTDLSSGERRTIRLTDEGEPQPPDDLPVTSLHGAALVGLRTGDAFAWRSDTGRVQKLRVDRVDNIAAARRERPKADRRGPMSSHRG